MRLTQKQFFKKKPRKTKRKISWYRRGFLQWGVSGILGGCLIIIPCGLWWKGYPQHWLHLLHEGVLLTTKKMGLTVQDVWVEGRQQVTQQMILESTAIRIGEPILAYTPWELKQRLEQLSWVRRAVVQRRLPGGIHIKLTERHPIALWQHQQKHYLVDEEGIIIKTLTIEPVTDLPIVVGTNAPAYVPTVLKLLEKHPLIRQSTKALTWVGNRRWDLLLEQGITVQLPEKEMEKALARLSILIQQDKLNPADVTLIDLRIPKKMIMRLSPTAPSRVRFKGKEA